MLPKYFNKLKTEQAAIYNVRFITFLLFSKYKNVTLRFLSRCTIILSNADIDIVIKQLTVL